MTRRSFLTRAAIALAAIAVAPSVSTALSADARDSRSARAWYLPLTPREAQILQMVAAEMTDAQIAASLGMSTWTVQHRVPYIYMKVDLARRSDVGPWIVGQRARTLSRIRL